MSENPKMVICKNCNTPISKNARICPACGAKNKKPIYKRAWFIFLIIIIAAGIIGSIAGKGSKKEDKKAEYRWPTSELVSLIPQPESKYGKINSESENYFSIDIYDMTNDQFEDYIEECKERGFTEDYTKWDGYYHAENADGFTIGLDYNEKEKEMSIMLNTPIEESPKSQEEVPESQETETPESTEAEDDETETPESTEAEDDETEKEPTEEKDLVDGMRPEFKEAMDSYEAFYDEYCDFMKKYKENPADVRLIAEYADMLKKGAEMDEKFAAWEGDDLNNAEVKYYAEVSARITQKLLEVAE